MGMVRARAPGKLLLTGEYAVLAGAPAASVAVGGPAIAAVTPADKWVLDSSAAERSYPIEIRLPDQVDFQGRPPEKIRALPTAVLVEVLRRWPDETQDRACRIALDTSAFVLVVRGEPLKIGLGSSAALVVAMAGAVLAACGVQAAADDFRSLCIAAHRALQQGRGSGVDVLTAIHGGVLVASPVADDLQAEPLAWPSSLHLVIAWTGQSASTPELIARYDAFRMARPQDFERSNGALAGAAQAAADAWRSGEAAAVLAAVSNYAEALRAIDAAGGIGIWTDAHEQLATLAARCGGVYKTSGAGGGDLGFLLTESVETAAQFRAAVMDSGRRVLDLAPGQAGLKVTGG